ncbi:MAG: alanine racemase, partial [Flavobacteriales bacterium]
MADNNTYLEINLKNLASNLNFLRSKINSNTKLLAVTKANGYGSDSIEVSKFLEKKVDYFAVAYTSEGVELRKNKIKSPILILHPQLGDFDTIQEYNLEPSIYSF